MVKMTPNNYKVLTTFRSDGPHLLKLVTPISLIGEIFSKSFQKIGFLSFHSLWCFGFSLVSLYADL